MTPKRVGLYNPAFEHDSCGVAMVVDMHGRRSRDIVDKAITALLNLEHRGAQGAEPRSGDGAGILIQVPDEFLREAVDFELPAPGSYATGIAFLPQSSKDAAAACAAVQKIAEAEGLQVLGWRSVPTDDSSLGALSRDAMPTFRQVFLAGASGMALERRCYVVRKRAEHELGTKGPGQDGPGRETVYFPSLSGQTLVYKGMLTTPQLKAFYLDLQDERLTSALGIVHSRFSTNTFPSWPLAHPFRRIAHNGEINTVTGNENWMRAREALIKTDIFGSAADVEKLFPICTPGASDTARFDEVLELLHLGGRSLAHAVLMMIPEAWERHESMDRAAGVLPVSRLVDGAVGRPGVDDVHRRHRRGRRAGPQWPTPVANLGHRRRFGGDGFRGRCVGPASVDGGAPDAAAAGPDVLGGHRAGPHRLR